MLKHSFVFNGVDVRKEYGIIVESIERPLFAPLRERKATAPFVSGSIDFGARFRDEQTVTLSCGTVEVATQAKARELAYLLSEKSELYLWDEPTHYYIGRIYDAASIERFIGIGKRFSLSFVCDPCVYGEQKTEQFNKTKGIRYSGTEETPTIITITNTNNYPLNGITLTMKEAYKS